MRQRRMGGATVSDPYVELTTQDGSELFRLSGNPKILVVDDEPTNIRVLTDALNEDYDLVVASNAAEAMSDSESEEKGYKAVESPESFIQSCAPLVPFAQTTTKSHITLLFLTIYP